MQSKKNIVPHNYLYHAEIIYETKEGFSFTSAVGNTMKELIDDINDRFTYYADRQPQLAEVLFEPNGEKIDITYKVRTIMDGYKNAI